MASTWRCVAKPTYDDLAYVRAVGASAASVSDPHPAARAGRPRQRSARPQRILLRESSLSFADARRPTHAKTATRLGRQSTGLSTSDPAEGRSDPLQLS